MEKFLSDEVKRALCSDLALAMGEDHKNHMATTKTKNSYHASKWDLFNTRILDSEILVDIVSSAFVASSLWEVVVSYHKPTKTLFLFIRKKRLEKLFQDFKDGKSVYHYISALLRCFNKDKGFIEGQINFLQPLPNEVLNSLSSKAASIAGVLGLTAMEVEQVFLVSFEEKYGFVSSVVCEGYNADFQLFYQEDWKEHLAPSTSYIVDDADDYSKASSLPNHNFALSNKSKERAKGRPSDKTEPKIIPFPKEDEEVD
ncbi:MAG: DUF5986 family protein [Defluviitaleaceae bacterium]|nr:DUF5986 family protein [Defluviitaleaceae bacterium]